jgi:hypothetical protein
MWLMLAHSLKFVNRPTRHYGQRAGVRQNERRTPSVVEDLCTAADRPYMAGLGLTWSACLDFTWTVDLLPVGHWNIPTSASASRLRDIQADRPLSYPRLTGTWTRCDSPEEPRQVRRESRSTHQPRRAIRRLHKPVVSRNHRKRREERLGSIQTSLVCLVPNGVRPC